MSENWITRVSEPDHLVLAWQAPDEFKDRTRFAVGELTADKGVVRLRYFGDDEEFRRLNPDRTYEQLLSYGYIGYPGFPLGEGEHRAGVLEAFMRRLPPRSRSDFAEYERHLRLRPGTDLTDFALLGLSEAYLPSDGFSVVDQLDAEVGESQRVIEVAGYRHYAKNPVTPIPVVGNAVAIVPEVGNEHDARAVAVEIEGCKIGNINRLQVEPFRLWAAQGRIEAWVERLNGRPDRPRLFLYVRIRPIAD